MCSLFSHTLTNVSFLCLTFCPSKVSNSTRALYRDPQLLFLDEATNSLDVINERKIVDALNGAFKDRTVIVVAHRLSTIRNADQIVVLDKGFIVEIGNHESLMGKKGHYHALVSSQMQT